MFAQSSPDRRTCAIDDRPGTRWRWCVTLIALCLTVSPAMGQSLRIATYNLNWGNRRGDLILDAVSEADPDVICFQETTARSERLLQERLANDYPHFHAFGHEGRYAAERFAIASRFELAEVSFEPPGKGLFGFCSVKFSFAGETVHVLNVHLAPVSIKRGGGIREVMNSLSAAEQKHAAEVAAICDAVELKHPTLVVGDFNSLSTFRAPQKLQQLGFVDAYASVHSDADAHPTWQWPTRPIPLSLRIDYVFHSPHFVATKANVVRRSGSDHSLVVAELKLGSAQATTPERTTDSDDGPPDKL